MAIKKGHIEVCEGLDWKVVEDVDCLGEYSGYADIRCTSPAGEDFSFPVDAGKNGEHFVAEVHEYAEAFDADEHVRALIKSGLSGMPSVREMIDDADELKEMLHELDIALVCYDRDNKHEEA